MKKIDTENSRVLFNSKIVAVFMMQTLVINSISYIVRIPYISIILMIALLFLIFFKNKSISIPKNKIYCYVLIAVSIVISSLLNGFNATLNYYLYFFSFGTVALLISALSVNLKVIIKNMLFISVISTLMYYVFQKGQIRYLSSLIDNKLDYSYDAMQMGIAFEFTYIAILSLSIIMFQKELSFNKKIIIFAIAELVLSVSIIIFDCWTRGAYLALGLSAFLLVVKKMNYDKIPVVIAFILFENMNEIIRSANTFFVSQGINIRVLTKQISLFMTNDASNGRMNVFEISWNMFKQSPLVGHGLGAFEKRSGYPYPHNIFLESMVEFGIVGLVCSVYVYYSYLKLIFLKQNNEEMIYKITIFLMSCLTLLTSGSFWTTPVFWLIAFSCLDSFPKLKTLKQIS